MDNNSSPITYTLVEVVKMLHTSRVQVSKYIHRKEHPLPAFKIGTGAKRCAFVIPADQLQQWLKEEVELYQKKVK